MITRLLPLLLEPFSILFYCKFYLINMYLILKYLRIDNSCWSIIRIFYQRYKNNRVVRENYIIII